MSRKTEIVQSYCQYYNYLAIFNLQFLKKSMEFLLVCGLVKARCMVQCRLASLLEIFIYKTVITVSVQQQQATTTTPKQHVLCKKYEYSSQVIAVGGHLLVLIQQYKKVLLEFPLRVFGKSGGTKKSGSRQLCVLSWDNLV